jgi:hypothetical protein
MRTRAFKLVGFLGSVVVLPGTFLSCLDGADIALGDCPNPDFSHLNRYGDLDPCCIDTSITPCGPSECKGKCMPEGPPLEWASEPVLLWYGPSSNTSPTCPDGMTGKSYYTDPLSSYGCLGCTCGAPACVLPSGMIASTMAMCQGPTFTNFPATDPNGCSTPIEIQPNTAKSLSLLAPTVSPCVPQIDIVVPKDINISPPWAREALVCTGKESGTCPPGNVCMAALPSAPPGYMHCIRNATKGEEDTSCPERYPHPLTIYEEELDNDASCTPCQCDPPVGSECTAQVSAFTDSSCVEASAIFKNYLAPLGPPVCAGVPVNAGLRGMIEKWLVNQPGQCSPRGGEPTGMPVPNPATAWSLCCEQDPAANF